MMVTVPTSAGESLVSRFEKIIKDAGAAVKVSNLGRKKLGYPIRKLLDADYFVLDFENCNPLLPAIKASLWMLFRRKLI